MAWSLDFMIAATGVGGAGTYDRRSDLEKRMMADNAGSAIADATLPGLVRNLPAIWLRVLTFQHFCCSATCMNTCTGAITLVLSSLDLTMARLREADVHNDG